MKISIENIKSLTILGLIIVIVLLQQCGRNSERYPEVSVITKVDTLKIKGKTDTLYIESEPAAITVHVPQPVTVTVPTDSGEVVLNSYTTIVDDDVITGAILSRVDGVLVSQELNYTYTKPMILRTDTIIVNSSTQVVEKRNYIGLGGEIGGSSNSFQVSPVISLNTRKGYTYSYRYGLLDKSHNIGITYNFKLGK